MNTTFVREFFAAIRIDFDTVGGTFSNVFFPEIAETFVTARLYEEAGDKMLQTKSCRLQLVLRVQQETVRLVFYFL